MIETLRTRLGPDLIPQVLEAGYNFDFFDDDSFRQTGRVEQGSLVLGANRYKVVILPGVESMPADTLQRLEEFARSGGILIATRRTPARAPGFQATESEHLSIADLSRRLFEGPAAPGHLVVDETTQLRATLNSLLQPDVSLAPAAPDVGFIRRSLGDAEIYFLANTGGAVASLTAKFRVAGLEPDLWDPMTGNVRPAAVAERSKNSVSVAMELEPHGSRIVVFSRRGRDGRPEAASVADSRGDPQTIDLSAGWRVKFGDDGIAVEMERLRSWTDDERTAYYSGLATYEKDFTLPDGFLRRNLRTALSLGYDTPIATKAQDGRAHGIHARVEGPVREAAVVSVNDRRAGSVWCPPWSIDVTELLQAGKNKIQIVVGNTAINHMAGRALPDYRLLNLRFGERFQPQDMDKVRPIPSGLMGPIRLIVREGD
jgi:hypothetical protein